MCARYSDSGPTGEPILRAGGDSSTGLERSALAEESPTSLSRATTVVCMGIFASTWGQTVTVGSVPLKTLLTEDLKISATEMAA